MFQQRHANNVSIVFHSFPLPYHKNGFDAAQAALVMQDALTTTTWRARRTRMTPAQAFVATADVLFAGQGTFQTDVTVNVTQEALFTTILAPLAAKLVISESAFVQGMGQTSGRATAFNTQARTAWKFGTKRGVSGTPTFAANGVICGDTNTGCGAWTLAEWEAWLVL